jgi:hypothetical protein
MARITADRLVRHLSAAGFVLMKTPPATVPNPSYGFEVIIRPWSV